MKLIFMQNNEEQIFDDFIRSRLDNTAPEITLLDSSFNTFLLERKEKKKKQRWFFWLFLFLLFFVVPFSYYIIPNNKNLKNSNQDINKESVSGNSADTSNSLNTETNQQKNIPDSNFVKRKKINNSFQPDADNKNSNKDVSKSPQSNFSDNPNLIQQNKDNNKTTLLDSSILPANPLQINITKAVDSLLKKKDKRDAKVDTFYIVW